tara:strand:- start:115 stop:327 length:213 start_codon:yes stop_codon:yes gene_type:complete
MIALLKKMVKQLLDLADSVFSLSVSLIDKLLKEISNIVELTFKVGIRVCALYLLYKLAFEGLLEKLVDKL